MTRRTLITLLIGLLVLTGGGFGAYAYLTAGHSGQSPAGTAVASLGPTGSGGTAPSTGTVHGAVTVRGGGTVRLAGAALRVPPGAVTSDGTLSASTVNPPRVTGTLGNRSSVGLRAASPPLSFAVTGTALIAAATLTVPADSTSLSDPAIGQRPDAFWLASFDPSSSTWQPVPSRYDPASNTVTAQVPHLSWWAVWTWDWPALALRLRQQLSGLGSGRAAQTSCPSPTPAGVSVTAAGGGDPPILGCVTQSDPNGDLTVAITNNRGYAMVLTGPAEATLGPPDYKGFDDWVHDRPAVIQALGGEYLAPTGTVTYTVPANGGPLLFTAAPSVMTHVIDEYVAAGTAVFGPLDGKCMLDLVAHTAPPSLSEAPGLAVTCLTGGPQNAYKHFLEQLQALRDYVQHILAAFDQGSDFLLQERGQVQITRPAAPVPDLAVTTGAVRGALYRHPGFPTSIAIDNHDSLSDLRWTIGATQATATGTLNQRNCVPDCATGTWQTFRVQLTAARPQQCTVTVYPDYSDTSQSMSAYVFTSFSVEALSGNPRPDLVGTNVVSSACG